MRWANVLHIYQPSQWNEAIIRQVADEAYRPILGILKHHSKVRITLHIAGSLSEQLQLLGLRDILDDIKSLMQSGQIELLGGAMYHPLLPLIPAEEMRRQIALQDDLHRRVFGTAYRPSGFYLPEMAYHPSLDTVLLDRGYQWAVVDELALRGEVGTTRFEHAYQAKSGLGLVPRNRPISDFLSFSANLESRADVADAILRDERSSADLITGMDGENLGHHRHGVEKLWQYLVTRPEVTTVTVSEQRQALGQPVVIESARACSWSSQADELRYDIPYGLWQHPDNPIHAGQWELTHLVLETVQTSAHDPSFDAARRLLDPALSSDKYWWASASPWWDPAIVLRETQKLADVVAPLQTLSTARRKSIGRVMDQIMRTVTAWQEHGIARKRQRSYLTLSGDVKYMGGRRIG